MSEFAHGLELKWVIAEAGSAIFAFPFRLEVRIECFWIMLGFKDRLVI